MLRKMATGADYFADMGGVVRVVAAIALTPFALLFALCSLMTPVAAVCIAFGGDWRLAGIVLGSALFYTLLAFPLCWLTVRLFRGRRSANGVTVLPTWLVRPFLLIFLGPLSVGMSACMFIWTYRAGVDRDWGLAVLWAVGGCGFLAGLARAVPTALRLSDRKTGDDAGPSARAEASDDVLTDQLPASDPKSQALAARSKSGPCKPFSAGGRGPDDG